MRVPLKLIGGNASDSEGNPLCFAFNLGNCTTKGEECEKGLHKCMKPGCTKQGCAFADHK